MAQQRGSGQPGFQYPMQTGFPGNAGQFQQGFAGGGLAPQPTGYPAQSQRPPFQQSQQTGYPGMGGMQPQPTGFPGGSGGFQQQQPPPVPPVPPLPGNLGGSGFGSMNTSSGFGGVQQYRPAPPPPPQRSYLNPSPAFGPSLAPQMTGFPGASPLAPQMTGYADPRLQMMSSTFMPANPSMPYSGGVPQFAGNPNLQPGTSLQQTIQQYNQESTTPKMSWALTKAEKKNYDQIFRAWDAQGTGYISGQTALEVFGQSGLDKNTLAKIWALADQDNKGKLNLAEFHVAMGLIYRKLNGLEVPDQLPPELIPPSARDLDTSVNFLKDILKHDTSRPSSTDNGEIMSRGKLRSFNDISSTGAGGRKDGTVYKHSDDSDTGSYYQSRSRHLDRRNVRVGNESPGEDLESMRRTLENTQKMLEKSAEESLDRTREDEELEREMEDLRYRIKRIQEDLEYVSRGPRSTAKDEERRKLERDLLHLMHERIPEVQKKQEERERRRERERRDWARERDRRNDRFGRYDDRDYDRYEGDGYTRGTYERDRPKETGYGSDRSRGWDRERDRDRDRDYDRERDRDRDADYDRDKSYRRSLDRPRSPPVAARSPPPPPPAIDSTTASRPAPAPKPATPSRPLTKEELREQAQRRVQERMRALGVITPGPSADSPSSPSVDTSVEERLAREKKEAEERARQSEKELEERERARREKLDSEKALKEGRPITPRLSTPAPAPPPPPVAAAVKSPPAPPAKRAPAPPPPPAKRGSASRVPVPTPAPPPALPTAVPAPPVPAVATPPAPTIPQFDPEEQQLREREERLRRQREERAARLRQLEQEEEEMRRAEEEYEKRRNERMASATKQSASIQSPPAPSSSIPVPPPPPTAPAAPAAPAPPTVASPSVVPPPPPPPPVPEASPPRLTATPSSNPSSSSPSEKPSTNPFSKFMNQGNGSAAATPVSTGSTNPFFKPPQPPVAPPPPVASPPVSKSPAPPAIKTSYNTVPQDDEDWGDVHEVDDGDSSDDEITSSRNARDMLAQQLFGGNRPQSAAGNPQTPPKSAPPTSAPAPPPAPPPPGGAVTAPVSPVTQAVPPPPPAAPPAPAAPAAAIPAAVLGDRSALLGSIAAGARLRKAVTNDRSAAPVAGRVLGDTAPPAHISEAPRPGSPSTPAVPVISASPEPEPIQEATSVPLNREADTARLNHRQSVDWYAGLAADQGAVSPLPTTVEENEDEFERPTSIPAIQVDEAPAEPSVDPMEDVDKSKEFRVRTLYPYDGQRPEDISFSENVVVIANPSKSGGAWWYGVTVKGSKSGFFPSTYVQELESVKAKALYSYSGGNSDELPFVEGDTLTIVDRSEADWWKTEQGGVIFIVPASYLEVVEGRSEGPITTIDKEPSLQQQHTYHHALSPLQLQGERHRLPPTHTMHIPHDEYNDDNEVSSEESTDEEEYHSFDSDSEKSEEDYEGGRTEDEKRKEHEARELERQRVLEAAGLLVVKKESTDAISISGDTAPQRPVRRRSTAARRRRAPPETPNRLSVVSLPSASPDKDLPATPVLHIDDAFERYEQYRLSKNYRLSMSSIDTGPPSPGPGLPLPPTLSTTPSRESTSNDGWSHSNIFKFLSRSKTPDVDTERPRLQISAPIMSSAASIESQESSAAFGSSWASLLNKDVLEGIPPLERKRQEAIFELINTEAAYVRDLQLIVEVFFSSMVSLLSEKETTVVFANIEDLLLVNTAFLSSLEERQKECRLYIDNVGDLLSRHMLNMGVYADYCINQGNAIKILQSIRGSRSDVAAHLQKLREDPAVRNLDLSSYLLAPMQRITRYPLLIRQILSHSEAEEECRQVTSALESVQRVLNYINEAIREQEGRARLEEISKNLYVGQGRLNLAKCTNYMGPRKLLKEGTLLKHKSGRKLRVFLCNDMIILTDEAVSRLYKMPIQLSQVDVKDLPRKEDTGFQLEFQYPRGGEAMAFRASSLKECQEWVKAIASATRRLREVERKAARAAGRR